MTINGSLNIKRQLVKIVFLTVICVTTILFMTGCPALMDYEYYITDNYSIWHINSGEIFLRYEPNGKGSYPAERVVDTYVREFCYNEQYVAVKQMDPDKINFDDFELNDFSCVVYYLVDMINNAVYGPYETEEEFNQIAENLSVGELCEWKLTRPRPTE